jgi:hypothetical protein
MISCHLHYVLAYDMLVHMHAAASSKRASRVRNFGSPTSTFGPAPVWGWIFQRHKPAPAARRLLSRAESWK